MLYICDCSSCYIYEIHPFRSTSERTEFRRPSLYLWAIEWKTEFIANRSKSSEFKRFSKVYATASPGGLLTFLLLSSPTTSPFIIYPS